MGHRMARRAVFQQGGKEVGRNCPHDRTVRRLLARLPRQALDVTCTSAARRASSTSIRRRGTAKLLSFLPFSPSPCEGFGHGRSVTSKLTSRRFPGTLSRRRQG